MARTLDKHLLQTGVLAARAAATVTGGDGGTQITAAAAGTDADTMIASAMSAAQAMDEKNVPEGDRYLYVRPAQYYQLVNSSSKLINRDYNDGVQNGSVAQGKVMSVAGLTIVKTNNLPITNITTDTAAYNVNASTTVALAMHRSAVGTVKLIDLAVESEYKIELQGTLIVSKFALGSGILRPEAAVEVKTA